MKRSIMFGHGAIKDALRDDDDLLPTLEPALGAGGGMTWNDFPEKVFGLGWFEVDQPSFPQSSKGKGGVPNCGVCMTTNQTSGTLHSLPRELFEGLAPGTKLTLALGEGEPRVTFEWNPDDSASQRVQLPQGWSPSPLAKCVYLVIPGHDFSIPVPILRREAPPLRRPMSPTISSSPSAKVA